MRLFVTGGAGFIGSHFCQDALAKGHVVYSWDRAFGHDLTNKERLINALHLFAPDWVIHLAATPGVSSDAAVGVADIVNTCNLLEAMPTQTKLMFVSTGSVYGRQHEFPTPEWPTMRPQESHYANAKLACENMARLWGEQNGKLGNHAVVLRLGTILGPGNNKGFCRDFVRRLQDDQTKLTTWGDGKQVKSYLHIDDMVSAMLDVMPSAGSVDTFNVAHDKHASIRDCITWVCNEMGVTPEIVYGDQAAGGFGDIPEIRLDNRRLRQTGWAPTKTIEQAVRDNVRWLLDQNTAKAAA